MNVLPGRPGRTATAGQHGLTMIELLVSTAIIGLIMVGVFSLFFTQSRITHSQEYQTAMQMELRSAVNELNFIFMHAGFGCASTFGSGGSISGTEPVNGTSATVVSSISAIQDGTSSGTTLNPDSVIVTYGQRKIADITGNATAGTSVTIAVTPVSGAPTPTTSGFGSRICFYPYLDANTCSAVTGVTGSSYQVASLSSGLNATAAVYLVAPSRIRVVDGVLRAESWLYAQAEQTSNSIWNLAENIEDFQALYFDGTNWSANPANPASISAVHFWILVRGERTEPGYVDRNTYQLAGQTVGPFNDQFHRMVSDSVVWIRNLQ